MCDSAIHDHHWTIYYMIGS